MRRDWALLLTLVTVGLLLVGCSGPTYRQVSLVASAKEPVPPTPTPPPGEPPLRVAVAAILSPQTTSHSYDPLLAYLEQHTGRPVELVQRSTYAETNELIRTHQVDLAFVCTGAYVRGEREFGMELLAVPEVNGQPTYRSYVIVPASNPAHALEDLRGSVFAFTDPLSLSGYLVPLYAISVLGESPDEFFARTLFTYSHENSIRAVAEGWVDGGGVDSLVYEAMTTEEQFYAEQTRVIWRSEPYGAPPVVVHPDLDPALKEQLREALLTMEGSETGREALAALGVDRFVPGEETWYDSARVVLETVGGLR
jgi:phosphonate transport system substrate-binding protein